jgi:hypothetical protein
MDRLKRRIDILCRKVLELPDNSEEFMIATKELRAALGEHASRLRTRLGEFKKKGFPSPAESGER